MDNNQIVTALFDAVQNNNLDIAGADRKFYTKLVLHAAEIRDLYTQLYIDHPESSANFTKLIEVLISSHQNRPPELRDRDNKKPETWYISNELAGMSLMADWSGETLSALPDKIPYLLDLGVNVLHLIPAIEKNEMAMTHAGALEDVRKVMHEKGMFLMLDYVPYNKQNLEYSNPGTIVEMLKGIFNYANLGVDVLGLDQSVLSEDSNELSGHNHTTLQLIKQCVQVTAPGMALLSNAMAPPADMMKYFGEGRYMAKECDFVYNATQMALQWDALASGQVSIMLAAQPVLAEAPFGTTWITFTRCRQPIKLNYDDSVIAESGSEPSAHRQSVKNYYTGEFSESDSTGLNFTQELLTADVSIQGRLASLCGLEKALKSKSEQQISIAIQKILLMQANSFFVGGLPMLFYGDEAGFLNDDSRLQNPDKSQDSRWVDLPVAKWAENELTYQEGTVENRIFSGTKKLLAIRKRLDVVADTKNTRWLPRHNIHVAGFVRNGREQALYCIFNYSNESAYLTWHSFRYNGLAPQKLYDHWRENYLEPGDDSDFLVLEPYAFYLLEVVS